MKFKEKLRYKYPLTKDSVVLDVGGYKGTFAAEIVRRYGCHVYVFEPVFDITPTENIHVYKYGLWHCDTKSIIFRERQHKCYKKNRRRAHRNLA